MNKMNLFGYCSVKNDHDLSERRLTNIKNMFVVRFFIYYLFKVTDLEQLLILLKYDTSEI